MYIYIYIYIYKMNKYYETNRNISFVFYDCAHLVLTLSDRQICKKCVKIQLLN